MDIIEKGAIADLTPDPSNANQGTERGQYMLTESVQSLGLGRSVVCDRNGILIAGNKTHATAGAIGLGETLVVRTTGQQLVVVQRDDLDLNAPTSSEAYQRARELAIADNQSSFAGLSWDAEVISEYIGEGVELDKWFFPEELEAILTGLETEIPELDEEIASDRKELGCVCPSCGHEFVRSR